MEFWDEFLVQVGCSASMVSVKALVKQLVCLLVEYQVTLYLPFAVAMSSCQALRVLNKNTRCTSEGLYEPVQCNRVKGETGLTCYCIHPLTGRVSTDTMRNVTNVDGLLDCHSHGIIVMCSMTYNHLITYACLCSFTKLPLTTCWPPNYIASWRNCTLMQPNQLHEVCMHLWKFIVHCSTSNFTRHSTGWKKWQLFQRQQDDSPWWTSCGMFLCLKLV